jgi:ribosomal protein S27AE
MQDNNSIDDDVQPYRPKTRCRRCGYGVTWREQRQCFGRLTGHGMDVGEVKKIMPLCPRCGSTILHEHGVVKA